MTTITANGGIRARAIHLIQRPTGMPDSNQFAIVESGLPSISYGQILIRNHFLSIDPAIRPGLSSGKTPLNEPIASLALGEVIASEAAEFSAGDFVVHRKGLRDYAISDAGGVRKIDVQEEPLQWHLGALGITGFTAYAGIYEVAMLKPGETIFVSAASGAVGSIAAQLARLSGCTVIGSTGSAEKTRWLRDVAKLDQVINYKEVDLRKALKEAAPDGLDVYFDNVGGGHLNAALPRMRLFGRVAICGMISAYNNPNALSEGVTTLATTMYNRVTLRAYIWEDHIHLWPQFLTAMRRWLKGGAIRAEETIYSGLNNAPAALIDMLAGKGLGKTIVKLQ